MASREFNESQHRAFRGMEAACGAVALVSAAILIDQAFFNGEYLTPADFDAGVAENPEMFFAAFGLITWAALWAAAGTDKLRREYASRL